MLKYESDQYIDYGWNMSDVHPPLAERRRIYAAVLLTGYAVAL
jgi:hypothetical protein